MTQEEDQTRRMELLSILTRVVIQEMMPFNKLFTGELETKYGVHLAMTQKGEHRHMRYKPQSGTQHWVRGRVLPWGGSVGWDITMDCKIACCRVGYDEYYNFDIEVLNDEQRVYYRNKYGLEEEQKVKEAMKDMDDAKLREMKAFLDRLLVEIDKG